MKRYVCVLTLAITACSTEPAQPPPVATAERYTTTDIAVDPSQAVVAGQDIPAQWWTLFQSPALDALVRQALENSPTIAQASARLRQANEERVARAGSAWLPRVDANLAANRVDIDPQALDGGLPFQTPFDLFFASVSVSYNLDLFGAARNEVQALQSGIDFEGYQLEAARLTLAGNVVTAAIREASLREQIIAVERMIAVQQDRLGIVEKLEQLGTASGSDVAAQRLEVAETRVRLPELRRQFEQVRHRLAVYTGQAPGAAQLPEFRLAELRLPDPMPLSLPSELARQRPDIRAAEALLQQASARVGVATANLFPQIRLTAIGGSLSTDAGDLFGDGTVFSLLGASLTQPLFHGRELQARRRAAIAGFEQAGANYQQVVLQGLQEVADVLRALEADAQKVRERGIAAEQAQKYRDIAAARYDVGGVSHFVLLDAERRLQSALLDRTQAIADRYANSAALLQALGGGWWQEEAAAEPPH